MSTTSRSPSFAPTGAVVYAGAFALSLLLHATVAAPYFAWNWVAYRDDSPGDEGTRDGPAGEGGGELLAPATPVQISVYRSAHGPKPTNSSSSAHRTHAAEPPPPDEPTGRAKRTGTGGAPPRGKKKPCEPIEEIVQVNDTRWRVERSLLDWYATHLRKAEKQVGLVTHRDANGKRDGVRLHLPRCSVLRQAGFKNKDIIRSVNGRKVYTIPQGVTTYLDVRKDRLLVVELTRKSGKDLTFKYKLK